MGLPFLSSGLHRQCTCARCERNGTPESSTSVYFPPDSTTAGCWCARLFTCLVSLHVPVQELDAERTQTLGQQVGEQYAVSQRKAAKVCSWICARNYCDAYACVCMRACVRAGGLEMKEQNLIQKKKTPEVDGGICTRNFCHITTAYFCVHACLCAGLLELISAELNLTQEDCQGGRWDLCTKFHDHMSLHVSFCVCVG